MKWSRNTTYITCFFWLKVHGRRRCAKQHYIFFHGEPMVNSPLIRPYLLGGTLDSHNFWKTTFLLAKVTLKH